MLTRSEKRVWRQRHDLPTDHRFPPFESPSRAPYVERGDPPTLGHGASPCILSLPLSSQPHVYALQYA
ncbi:uncharacterized protein B0H18DRAFT_1032135 [Fomitopsis serialis]|uniref:uncharacterized protein n=1 Tax=Fomitopsis serialis TaxID=139415 RepID=UPI0020081240|nr:uncharacterized protein B0H18DRAFT_1050776 [Neoantrodia serialis]XP_047888788.1 uncharacterized protein B0H18DRAFT_1032135 [Neoantrodia serialis]KAH9913056.1 hypothetical protein B0H18DRAFT_1050776 [Neoantrodia serialis]KAH9918124.1 hypothetical protein B0H18DRAFT_1032135 [Neoantrodia serialis]